ncbi:MAG: phosphoglyceromutase [Mucilaginibacter sp.]|nr:phosphoglyceromutase [Mucilaginibacter sp.]
MKNIILILLAVVVNCSSLLAQSFKTKNVIIVTLDGLRWQELYRGADSALINSKYTDDKPAVRKQFWSAAATDRRKLLFPFIWSTVVQGGQLYGNRDLGSKDEVANPYYFSYPGYNELFTGFPDPHINSNGPVINPNVNVLEYINKQKEFENKVAVFASWERFPQILNAKRSGLLINAGYMNLNLPNMNARLKYLNEMQYKTPHYLGDSTRLDFLTFEFAKEYLKQYQPRVLYVAFDETDEMAHSGYYKFYLDRAHQEDAYIQELWEYLQSNPVYKDKTTLIITCDHGRGDVTSSWRNHGSFIAPHSEQTWFGVLGPDTPSLGEMKLSETTYHKQLAQTIAKLLGLDFKAAAGHEVGEAINSVTGIEWLGASR